MLITVLGGIIVPLNYLFMEIPSKEDLQAVEKRLLKELSEIKDQLNEVKPKRRWLKSKEFMELFGIKKAHTLKVLRDQRQVKAKMKLSEWYYDTESFL